MTASACRVTSKASVGLMPANGQAVTLRTLLPHASRVVSPAAASCAMTAGASFVGIQ